MPIPTTTEDELRKVHAALRMTVPFEHMSPFLRHSLEMVAHCWRGRVPAHLWGKPAARQSLPTSASHLITDFKRRAAGDFE